MTDQIPIYETTVVNGVPEETLVGHRPAPRPPRDTRAQVKTLMFRLAAGFTVLAMGLSVAAIGALFSGFVPAYVAYSVAAVYDGLWIYALLGEWMAQTHPKARRACQVAGVFFMAVSMAAIILAAAQLGMVGAGIIASLVPLSVKAAWWLRLETTTHRLPLAYQVRLERERDKVHTALAMEIEHRELAQLRRQAARVEQATVAELLAMEAETGITAHLLVTQDAPAEAAVTGPSPAVRSAVRTALQTVPNASPDDVVELLRRVGLTTTADTVRELSGQPADTADSRSEASISDVVRSLVYLGVTDADSVLGAVRTAVGEHVDPETVARILRRVTSA
ncbi:hypothetical protein [Streptacidiphilus sp. PAMC 29251]